MYNTKGVTTFRRTVNSSSLPLVSLEISEGVIDRFRALMISGPFGSSADDLIADVIADEGPCLPGGLLTAGDGDWISLLVKVRPKAKGLAAGAIDLKTARRGIVLYSSSPYMFGSPLTAVTGPKAEVLLIPDGVGDLVIEGSAIISEPAGTFSKLSLPEAYGGSLIFFDGRDVHLVTSDSGEEESIVGKATGYVCWGGTPTYSLMGKAPGCAFVARYEEYSEQDDRMRFLFSEFDIEAAISEPRNVTGHIVVDEGTRVSRQGAAAISHFEAESAEGGTRVLITPVLTDGSRASTAEVDGGDEADFPKDWPTALDGAVDVETLVIGSGGVLSQATWTSDGLSVGFTLETMNVGINFFVAEKKIVVS